jgi:hypothetical protein
MSGVAERIAAAGSAADDEWSAQETLAHVASQQQRQPPASRLLDRSRITPRGNWQRTLRLPSSSPQRRTLIAGRSRLRKARIEDLTRRVRIGEGRHFSAEEIIRLGLCAHIEMHLEQIELALGPRPVVR